jgi:hypothetical protein
MWRRGAGRLIVFLFVGVLIGNAAGEVLKLLFEAVGLSQSVVEKVLVEPLVRYEFFPSRINLLVLTFTFGFSLNFSLFSLLGLGLAWYYFKYFY